MIFNHEVDVPRVVEKAFSLEIHYAIMALDSCTYLIAIIPDTAYPGVFPVPMEKNSLGDMLHAETE